MILTPEYEELNGSGQNVRKGDITHRAQIRSQIDYSKSLKLLEAIDDKAFYALARKADDLVAGIGRARKKIKRIKDDILSTIFNSTDLGTWFNDNDLKNKRDQRDKEKSSLVQIKIDEFINHPTPFTLRQIILQVKVGLKSKYKREELLGSLLKALNEASQDNMSVTEAMKRGRNTIRRSGRKVHGKCLGTTLLTKGLEFDTVVILDAHKFNCPKHLYVALTRCCKKLIIFTASTTLNPYSSTSGLSQNAA